MGSLPRISFNPEMEVSVSPDYLLLGHAHNHRSKFHLFHFIEKIGDARFAYVAATVISGRSRRIMRK